MRGRSKVRFMEQKRDALSLEQVEDKSKDDGLAKVEWLRKKCK